MRASKHPGERRLLSHAIASLLEDLDLARWCKGPVRERRCAHAAKVFAVIARLDPALSRELEATVIADSGVDLRRQR